MINCALLELTGESRLCQKYHHLTLNERRTLYKLLEAVHSKEEIACHLRRHRSTIYRELQRNTHHHEEAVYQGYFHVLAK
ncbi:MAG: helix-turn-helix domain-containing protein [Alphaproteobacteria bacterium]|nr:helix-turn-helix domain-containing protein [Alphaproteobacteria bacterium]